LGELKTGIRLKIKAGKIEFEIECEENQLKGILEKVLSTIPPQQRLPSVKVETCKHVIQKLWLEGWFSSPKTLTEVCSEMSRRGFHYNRGHVAHVLVDLVKENLLTREGQPRRYLYVQKKEPPLLQKD
jgi:hypothetical protein